MREVKHTPGPWFAEQVEYSRGLDTSFEVHVDGEVLLQTIMREKGDGWRSEIIERDRANVTLAAAAPELLEALRKAEEHIRLRSGDGETNFRAELNAVIAKAEGASNA